MECPAGNVHGHIVTRHAWPVRGNGVNIGSYSDWRPGSHSIRRLPPLPNFFRLVVPCVSSIPLCVSEMAELLRHYPE